MSMLLYDIKKGRKFTITYITAIFAVCVLLLGFLAFWYYKLNPTRDQIGADGLPKVALAHYVPATYETFNCLAEGADECGDFGTYVESLSSSPVAFTYTPSDESDPGTVNADGTRTLTLDSGLSPSEWTAVGKAVTQDSSLNGAQINPDDVSIDGSVATASVAKKNGEGASTAHITFQFSGSTDNPSSVRVTGVTYGEGETGG